MNKNFSKSLRLAYIITTYDKVVEAKGQMEIIRSIWENLFASVDVYHEYNGSKDLYPNKYLETSLFRHVSKSHYSGAVDLINQGIAHVLSSARDYDYIVVASADVWVYNPHRIMDLFKKIKGKSLITTLWAGPFFATEFFVITPHLARAVFPLPYESWMQRNRFLRFLNNHTSFQLVEYFFTKRVKAVCPSHQIAFIPTRTIFLPYYNRYETLNFYSSHHRKEHRRKSVRKSLTSILGDNLKKTPTLASFLANKEVD